MSNTAPAKNPIARIGVKFGGWGNNLLKAKIKIIEIPNITDVFYGRGVGYTFTEHDLGKDIHEISATKIRKEMREDGNL